MSKPENRTDRLLRLVFLYILYAVSYGWVMILAGVSILHAVVILAVATVVTDILIDRLSK